MSCLKALMSRLSIVLATSFLIGPPVSAAPDTFNAPAMELTPEKGATGQAYLIDLFMQVCIANKENIARLTQLSPSAGWHMQVAGKVSSYKITTGRAGWPEVEVQKTSDGALCAIVWTLDPNEGVGSVQDEFEKITHVKLDGK